MIYLYQILFLIITYLIASIPFGLVVSKIFAQQDIRESGSGNIGATNVTRILGKRFGIATLLLDGLKGAIMVIIARFIFVNSGVLNVFLILVGAVAVIGHIFPIYLRFKGGKGVATALAVLLTINPITGLVGCFAWAIIFACTKTSSIASLASTTILTGFALYTHALPEEILFCIFLTTLIFIRHKENISRLLKGEEQKFTCDKK